MEDIQSSQGSQISHSSAHSSKYEVEALEENDERIRSQFDSESSSSSNDLTDEEEEKDKVDSLKDESSGKM